MNVVSDTGPLIALYKLERLDLLLQLGWTPVLCSWVSARILRSLI